MSVALDSEPILVGAEEAARILGVSRRFLYRHVLTEIPSVRKGGLRRFPVAALRAWVEREARVQAEQVDAARNAIPTAADDS